LLSLVTRKTVYKRYDPWGYVRLMAALVRVVVGPRRLGPLKKRLEAIGVEYSTHVQGVRSIGFRPPKSWFKNELVEHRPTNPRVRERLGLAYAEASARQRSRRKPIHDELERDLWHLTITDEAEEILAATDCETAGIQKTLIRNIRSRRFGVSIGSTGRVFNPLTGLKRELRRACRLDSAPLGSVDMSCTQPFLLAVLIQLLQGVISLPSGGKYGQHNSSLSSLLSLLLHAEVSLPSATNADWLRYLGDVSDGTFYERLVSASGLTRDEVKQSLQRDLIARRTDFDQNVAIAFRDLYRPVWLFIRSVNRSCSAALIRILQTMESWLFIEVLAPQLVGLPIVTLHDAIFCRYSDRDYVEAVFADTSEGLGFNFRWKCEDWRPVPLAQPSGLRESPVGV
jgi:hypothetical protein